MEFQEFVNQVVNQLPEYLLVYDIESIRVEEIKKNNGVICTGVVICLNGDNVAPNIYLEYYYSLYNQGKSMDEILQLIVKEYSESRRRIEDDGFSIDLKGIRDRIFMRLVNYEKNKEMLQDCPYELFNDLAITYRYLVKQNHEGIASAVINFDELKRIGIIEKELKELAYKNTKLLFPPKVDFLNQILQDMTGRALPEGIPLYVLTNEQFINGATSIVYDEVMKQAAELIGGDFYILPSSVHEVLLLPVDCGDDEKYLSELVREVNSSVLQEMDYLSDNVYKYSIKTNSISVLA